MHVEAVVADVQADVLHVRVALGARDEVRMRRCGAGLEGRFAPVEDLALYESDGYVTKWITDLRTGAELPFTMWGSGPYLEGVDWSDVDRFGVKVLVFEF